MQSLTLTGSSSIPRMILRHASTASITVCLGLVLVVVLAFFASRRTIEFPVSLNLLDMYKRLELKLFETEKLRDPTASLSEDGPVNKGDERTNTELEVISILVTCLMQFMAGSFEHKHLL